MNVATAHYAFDKQSARSFDADGRMRVPNCVITNSEVNPYYGKEIPKSKDLGLDANTVYDLYRDPVELERAAASFNQLPLMIRHIAQTADEPRKEYIGGSIGNVRYQDGKLLADLLIWDRQAIDYVQSGQLADLSCSYRYTADMTPVEVNGRKAHGSMRNIEGNHVALVEDGRATGAHVADSALSSPTGASNVDPTDIPNSNPDGAAALVEILSKLASIETRLTAVEGAKTQTPQSEAENGLPANVNTSPAAEDSDPDGDDKDDKDDKPAMDAKTVQGIANAAVAAAVAAERKRAKGVEDAKLACRDDLGVMIAMDDAGEIYREALKRRGVDVSAVPAGAEQATYQAIVSVTARRPVTLANDNKPGEKPVFNTSHIRNLGRA